MMNQVILGQDNCDMYNNFTAPSQLNSRAGDETLQNVFTTEPDTAVCGDNKSLIVNMYQIWTLPVPGYVGEL